MQTYKKIIINRNKKGKNKNQDPETDAIVLASYSLYSLVVMFRPFHVFQHLGQNLQPNGQKETRCLQLLEV